VTAASRRGALGTGKPAPPMAPDNTRRALLAVAERLRVVDQLTRPGAALPAVATHLPATTPTDAREFAQRMESVDQWLAARAQPDVRASAPPIQVDRPIKVATPRQIRVGKAAGAEGTPPTAPARKGSSAKSSGVTKKR
jgi:hypothetical protein